jgi:hypothetical protein
MRKVKICLSHGSVSLDRGSISLAAETWFVISAIRSSSEIQLEIRSSMTMDFSTASIIEVPKSVLGRRQSGPEDDRIRGFFVPKCFCHQ